MTFPIDVQELRVHFGEVHAIDDVSLSIPAGVICGLLGRNGAGKTTLLSVLAAFRQPASGVVRIDGEDPYEHARLMSEICLVRENGDFEPSTSVAEHLSFAGSLRPRWDAALADRLVDRFELPRRTKAGALSRGQRSALAVTIGLASRAPLTMFDEPHLGMDAPSRYAFYEELLADYLAVPRTVVMSTHLIDEAATLFEEVVIIDRGRLLMRDTAERLRGMGSQITGPEAVVDTLTAGMPILAQRQLGPTKSVVALNAISDEQRATARLAGVEIGPIPLQDLFVHLTAKESTP
jgi:ABC-2 type transport system ATP-binding protein